MSYRLDGRRSLLLYTILFLTRCGSFILYFGPQRPFLCPGVEKSIESSSLTLQVGGRITEVSPLYYHHTALKTRNITNAIQFYSLLGYTVSCRFRTGPARAAWLVPVCLDDRDSAQSPQSKTGRLELIEVPTYMLGTEPSIRIQAPNLIARPDILGYNHLALDVTHVIQFQNFTSLADYIQDLNRTSMQKFGKMIRVAVQPRQQIIGQTVYELAFLYDADGCLIELLFQQDELAQTLDSGWEPWDGQGFLGEKSPS